MLLVPETGLIKPRFELWYRGINISSELDPHTTMTTYTDKVHGEADEIEVAVQDKDGRWRGDWCPEQGDKCKLNIYADLTPVPCGEFEIDEPHGQLSRSPNTFGFRGVSAPVTKSLRTDKTKAYEKQSLKQIAQKVADDHGFTIVGKPPDVEFERVTQRRERDLQFLTRMADAFGSYFTVKGMQLIFMDRDELHSRGPVRTFRAYSQDYITGDIKRASHKTYSKAKVSYFDGNKKKNIDVQIEDQKVKTGDTLRIDERVENEGQARLRARSELQKANMKAWTSTIVCIGDPYLQAGQTYKLDSGWGKWAGIYLIKQSRHQETRDGYTTNVEGERVS